MKAFANFPFVLLSIFVSGGVLTLFSILKGGGETMPALGGRVSHGPAEFPTLFEDPLLAGLPAANGKDDSAHIRVPPPPFSKDIFPCSECHDEDLPPNPTVRKLKLAHDDIALTHGGENRWCFDCHNPIDRDKLRLANGTLVGFEESYRLCGQCHGEIYRDWREGIHGRRIGDWDGAKRYLLCAHCHNPHSPRFKPLVPLPPPVRPDFLGH